MSGLNKPPVFIVVTIPTHLRTMMDVADLLQASGRYQPHMIYYPSVVFDENTGNCSAASHPAWIWNGTDFLSGSAYQTDKQREFHAAAAATAQTGQRSERTPWLERLLRKLPHRGIYLRWRRSLPFLPSPSQLLWMVYLAWGAVISPTVRGSIALMKSAIPALRVVARAYGVVNAIGAITIEIAKLALPAQQQSPEIAQRNLRQRLFLVAFAKAWRFAPGPLGARHRNSVRRLKQLFNDGLFSGLEHQKNLYRSFSGLLDRIGPALVVLPEENLFYQSHLIVHAAHAKETACVVVPFTIVNALEWGEAFFEDKLFQVTYGWNRMLAKAFPHWVLSHRGRQLILPSAFVLGCEYLGVVPDQPWVINSGPAEAIAGESQFMCDYYIRAGIRPAKVRFTGALSDDRLFALLQSREAQRRLLEARAGIGIVGKVVLIGLPPDQFAGAERRNCEFRTHEELLKFMVGTAVELCGDKNTVLLNLHPRIARDQIKYLENSGATIISEPIDRLVPLSDIYVAVVSATIRLAISTGVPVVNYDAYQYDYDDYVGLPGVCEIKLKEDYRRTLAALIKDDAFYASVQTAQKDTAARLCKVDGNAGIRLLDLFDELSCRQQDVKQQIESPVYREPDLGAKHSEIL